MDEKEKWQLCVDVFNGDFELAKLLYQVLEEIEIDSKENRIIVNFQKFDRDWEYLEVIARATSELLYDSDKIEMIVTNVPDSLKEYVEWFMTFFFYIEIHSIEPDGDGLKPQNMIDCFNSKFVTFPLPKDLDGYQVWKEIVVRVE